MWYSAHIACGPFGFGDAAREIGVSAFVWYSVAWPLKGPRVPETLLYEWSSVLLPEYFIRAGVLIESSSPRRLPGFSWRGVSRIGTGRSWCVASTPVPLASGLGDSAL